jgi:TRAP-type mannitol/chloroaromatic compound transport system permease small subunit
MRRCSCWRAGYTLLVDGHVRVDIFYAKASRRRRAAIDLVGHLVFLLPTMLVILVLELAVGAE